MADPIELLHLDELQFALSLGTAVDDAVPVLA